MVNDLASMKAYEENVNFNAELICNRIYHNNNIIRYTVPILKYFND